VLLIGLFVIGAWGISDLFKRALEIRPDYTDALKNLERVKEQPGLMDSNAIL
jgi:hypothetical protein